MSSPSPERDFARTLLGKAREDLEALGALHERGGIADSVLGFHAQQAVEKALKALLVAQGWELRRTHDLQFLIEQTANLGIELHWPSPPTPSNWHARFVDQRVIPFRGWRSVLMPRVAWSSRWGGTAPGRDCVCVMPGVVN